LNLLRYWVQEGTFAWELENLSSVSPSTELSVPVCAQGPTVF
jgi:hypothetical protein